MNLVNSNWSKLMTMEPVNKVSSVVVNQCGVSSELELNSTVEQRRILKQEAQLYTERKTKRNPQRFKQVCEQLKVLNKQLEPYDHFTRETSNLDSFSALRLTCKHYLPRDVYKFLLDQSRQLERKRPKHSK